MIMIDIIGHQIKVRKVLIIIMILTISHLVMILRIVVIHLSMDKDITVMTMIDTIIQILLILMLLPMEGMVDEGWELLMYSYLSSDILKKI